MKPGSGSNVTTPESSTFHVPSFGTTNSVSIPATPGFKSTVFAKNESPLISFVITLTDAI